MNTDPQAPLTEVIKSPDALDREAVARIIEPSAWEEPPEEGWEWAPGAQERCQGQALAKADAILALAPARGWRDIASAPRDGTIIAVTGCNGILETYAAHWDGPAQGWKAWPYGYEHYCEPTHWLPLPPAPETKP